MLMYIYGKASLLLSLVNIKQGSLESLLLIFLMRLLKNRKEVYQLSLDDCLFLQG